MTFTALQTLTAAQLNDLDITTLTTSGTVTIGGFTLPAVDGSADQVLVTNGSGTVTWQDAAGGAPGGSDGQIQYNNGGAFGGSSSLTFDDATGNLTVGGSSQTTNVAVTRTGTTLGTPGVSVANSGGSGDYNYFLNASNDAGVRAVMFVNGSTRTADGGTNTMTIRNDGGGSRFGNGSYLTTITGSAVYLAGSVGINDSTPSYSLDVNGTGRFTGDLSVNATIITDYIRNDNGNFLALEGGDGWNLGSNASGEYVWMAAEGGIVIVSSDSNSTVWANRNSVRISPSGGIDQNLVVYAKELRVNNTGGANAKIGRWQANDDYAMFGTDDMTGAEYCVLGGGATDGNTYISAQSGAGVYIRPSANSSTNAALFTTSGTTMGAVTVNSLTTSGTVSAGRLQVGGHYIDDVAGSGNPYGSINVGGAMTWDGYAIDQRVVFMHDGSSAWGIYNDTHNHWMIYGIQNGGVELKYANSTKIVTQSDGTETTGIHTSRRSSTSSNWAHMQFEAATGSTSNSTAGIAGHLPNLMAGVWRVWYGNGEGWDSGNSGGNGYRFVGASSFVTRSSERWKKNIHSRTDDEIIPTAMNLLSCRTAVWDETSLDPVCCDDGETFEEPEMCDDPNCDCDHCAEIRNDPIQRRHFGRRGYIVEELEQVFPDAVFYERDGSPSGIDYSVITAELIDIVKLLVLQGDENNRRLSALEQA